MARKNVLLLKTGTAAPELCLRAGDYHRWFEATVRSEDAELTRVEVHLGEQAPQPWERYDAIILSGSPKSLTTPEPWMAPLGEQVRELAERGKPILGVCFGHQLLGQLYGARVVKNPRGREIGTIQVRLTAAGRGDPLFAGVTADFSAQATHTDIVDVVPPGATVLAGNASTPLQAMAVGKNVRSVQFHPELSAAGMTAVVETRAQVLEEEALAAGAPAGTRVRELLAAVSQSHAGPRILHNFLEAFT